MFKIITIIGAACFASTAAAQDNLPDCPVSDTTKPLDAIAWMTIPNDSTGPGNMLGGTVWFIDKQQVVAVLHEHAGLLKDWSQISLSTGNVVGEAPKQTRTTLARILHTVDTGTDENLYILELAETFEDIRVPKISFNSLIDNEPVYSLTYRDGIFAIASGRNVLPEQTASEAEPDDSLSNFLLFELADPSETDRMVISEGSSGSPIFDCNGNVVAAVAKVATQEENYFLDIITKSSTAWGEWNVAGVSSGTITKPY